MEILEIWEYGNLEIWEIWNFWNKEIMDICKGPKHLNRS